MLIKIRLIRECLISFVLSDHLIDPLSVKRQLYISSVDTKTIAYY